MKSNFNPISPTNRIRVTIVRRALNGFIQSRQAPLAKTRNLSGTRELCAAGLLLNGARRFRRSSTLPKWIGVNLPEHKPRGPRRSAHSRGTKYIADKGATATSGRTGSAALGSARQLMSASVSRLLPMSLAAHKKHFLYTLKQREKEHTKDVRGTKRKTQLIWSAADR